jgi:NitT/TauT family transport system ATP-binding protein
VREAVRLSQRVILMSSRPGRIINEWQIASDEPRRIESKIVSELSLVITEELRKEIKRHG